MLNRPDYLDMIKSELPNWLDDAKDLTDNRAKWDWLKFKIKTSSITYSKKLAQERESEKRSLTSSIKMHYINFKKTPVKLQVLD